MNNLLTLPLAATRTVHASADVQRLAVAGWIPEAHAALDALTSTGRFQGVGITDTSGSALVSARSGTGLSCHQQVWSYLQHAEYDAVLAGGELALDAARIVIAREADLLLLAETIDPTQLTAIADLAASRHHEERAGGRKPTGRIALIQPAMQEAGFAQLTHLVTTMEGWTARYLDITVEGATDPGRLLGIAVGQFIHLHPEQPLTVTAEFWGYPMRATSIGIESPGCRTQMTVRHAPTPYMRIAGDAEAGAFEWRLTEADVSLARTDTDGSRLAYEPPVVSHWDAEAQRIADRHTGDDTALLKRTAELLDAVRRAATSGEPQSTGCCSRTERRTDESGAPSHTARPPYLRLVTP